MLIVYNRLKQKCDGLRCIDSLTNIYNYAQKGKGGYDEGRTEKPKNVKQKNVKGKGLLWHAYTRPQKRVARLRGRKQKNVKGYRGKQGDVRIY